MKKNIGTKDRLIRLAISIVFFIVAYLEESWLCLAAALFVLFEVAMSWCIIYQYVGKNTCDLDKK